MPFCFLPSEIRLLPMIVLYNITYCTYCGSCGTSPALADRRDRCRVAHGREAAKNNSNTPLPLPLTPYKSHNRTTKTKNKTVVPDLRRHIIHYTSHATYQGTNANSDAVTPPPRPSRKNRARICNTTVTPYPPLPRPPLGEEGL